MRPERRPDPRPVVDLPPAVSGRAETGPFRPRSAPNPSGLSPQEFLDVAASLHRELEGERARRRLHAVIEQAKGILVAQHGITLTEAFERLRAMSQEHNVRLVEVAATLVGATLPPGGRLDVDLSSELHHVSASESAAWSRYRTDPGVRGGTASALFDSRARSADVVATGVLLGAVCASLGNDAAALYRLTPEHRLALVTSSGLAAPVVTAWQSIPPGVDVPAVRAATTGVSVAVRDLTERARLFPRLLTTSATHEASLCVPIRSGDRVTGVLVLLWEAAHDAGPELLARAEHTAGVAGPVLISAAGEPALELSMVAAVLDILFDLWLVAEPVERGPMPGFRITSASRDIQGAHDLPGRRVLELWPALAVSDVFAHLLTVHRTGQPWVTRLTAEQAEGLPRAAPGTELRVIRLGSSLLIHWR